MQNEEHPKRTLALGICLRSCILVLIVSRGWQQELSTRPAAPPAIRFSNGCFRLGFAGAELLVAKIAAEDAGPSSREG